jgi:hypothetical protein
VDPIYALIRRAIAEKLCVEAVFGGHRRQLCPHLIGTRAGQPRALFFQFGGGSGRGLDPGGDWRCLSIAGLSEVSVRAGEWHTTSHSELQHCLDEIDLEATA